MRLDEMSVQELGEELMLLTFSKRLLLIAGVWLVFLLLFFLLVWKNSLNTSQQLEIGIQESLARLDTQSQLLLDQAGIEAELAQLEAQLPLLKTALPSERELASLLARINQLILDHGLILAEFTPQASVNQEVMRVVPVKVSLRGDGEEISRLPNYIAALSRQVKLREFDMAYLPDGGGWQMNGELNAYAQLPANAPKIITDEPLAAQAGESQNP